ncbi:hypothetical protein Pla22_42710 [Rubripirellula amarantea]|uniref:Uncharacterized protein n=1 Tax=Rubripirellula amarantea TaxID=2527999 RepID=A0A5C5WG50_9BACT|nr:hypothetical protein [Rubripirellula amarantea]TWT49079.1 hypothetical protein Pla22_42710 [Rubripirellula amarantea]
MRASADEKSTVAAGCLSAAVSASITSLMLFINGALVMAVLSALAQSGPEWAGNPKFTQFMVFTIPVALVVAQWMMIDYVRTRFMPPRK